jgi:hypothetical protein
MQAADERPTFTVNGAVINSSYAAPGPFFFHPPLSRARHWEALHARWAAAIADALNDDLLPEGYFAEAPVHAGRVEVDVATFAAERIARW